MKLNVWLAANVVTTVVWIVNIKFNVLTCSAFFSTIRKGQWLISKVKIHYHFKLNFRTFNNVICVVYKGDWGHWIPLPFFILKISQRKNRNTNSLSKSTDSYLYLSVLYTFYHNQNFFSKCFSSILDTLSLWCLTYPRVASAYGYSTPNSNAFYLANSYQTGGYPNMYGTNPEGY